MRRKDYYCSILDTALPPLPKSNVLVAVAFNGIHAEVADTE